MSCMSMSTVTKNMLIPDHSPMPMTLINIKKMMIPIDAKVPAAG